MNTPILAVCLALCAVVSTVRAANTENGPGLEMHRVTRVSEHVEIGTPRIAVTAHLGEPAERLTPSVWVYHGFRPSEQSAIPADCSTLVITFDNGAVCKIQLMNSAAADGIRARVSGTR